MEEPAPSSASSIYGSGNIGIGISLHHNKPISWRGPSTISRGISPNPASALGVAASLQTAITNHVPCRSSRVDTWTTRRRRNATKACTSFRQQASCGGVASAPYGERTESNRVLDAAALQDRLLRNMKLDLGGQPQALLFVSGGGRGGVGGCRRKRYRTIPLTPIGSNPNAWLRVRGSE